MSNSNSIWSFFARYWVLLLWFVIFTSAAASQWVFNWSGPLIYIPCLLFSAVCGALLIRHWLFNKTIDEDVRTGLFERTWDNELSPVEKVRWTIVVTLTLIVAASMIASALASR